MGARASNATSVVEPGMWPAIATATNASMEIMIRVGAPHGASRKVLNFGLLLSNDVESCLCYAGSDSKGGGSAREGA